jgi:hypothetical protein
MRHASRSATTIRGRTNARVEVSNGDRMRDIIA